MHGWGSELINNYFVHVVPNLVVNNFVKSNDYTSLTQSKPKSNVLVFVGDLVLGVSNRLQWVGRFNESILSLEYDTIRSYGRKC